MPEHADTTDTRPWLVTAAVYNPPTDGHPGAILAAMYFEPWQLVDGQDVDPEDFATVTSCFDVESEPDMAKFSRAAYETGAHMADMFGIDSLRVWPGLDSAAKDFVDTLPEQPDTEAHVEACEPDDTTGRLLQEARDALARKLRAKGA